MKKNDMGVALVTRASSGIGLATARALKQAGYRVFGTSRRAASGSTDGITMLICDVTDDASVQKMVADVVKQAERIDVLVNNAGVAMVGAAEETSMDEAKWMFETNVFGMLRTTQAVLPHMRKQRSGRIVNVSSVLGFLPAPYMGLYAATKHAVEGMSETLDHELRQFGIRVTLVEPGFTKSSLDANSPQVRNRISAYDAERSLVSSAISKNIGNAPEPDGVANTIVCAARGSWRMRHTPKGQASLLSKLRRFMPARPVDQSLRKSFGLS